MPSLIENLEIKISNNTTTAEKIDAINELSWELKESDKQRSKELFDKAYYLSTNGEYQNSPYQIGIADSYKNQAYFLMKTSAYREALDLGNQTIILYANLDNLFGQGVVLAIMGAINSSLGNYAKALEQLLRGFEIFEETDSVHGKGVILNNLGNLYSGIGDDDKKIETYLQAEKILYQVEDTAGIAIISTNLALAYLEKGDFEKALKYAQQTIDIATEETMYNLIGSGVNILGRIELLKGNYSKAIDYFNHSFKMAEKSSSKSLAAFVNYNLAQTYEKLGDDDKAINLLLKGLSIAEKVEELSALNITYKALSELYKKKKDFETALVYFEKYFLIESQFNESYNRIEFEKLKFQNEFEKINQEKELLQANQEKLNILATIDELTGIYNRRHIFQLAKEELSLSISQKQKISIILIDLDYFKNVNDQYGHLVGDKLLRLIAIFIQEILRDNDIVGRYGGEEFIIVLPKTNLDHVIEIAQRIIKNVNRKTFYIGDHKIKITMSIGISYSTGEPPIELDKLLEQSDIALYEAKNAGRNQYVIYEKKIQ